MSASLAERLERKQSARLAKQASYHARAAAYFRTHGEDGKAEVSEAWLREHLRCRCCHREISAESAERYDGLGPDCFANEEVRKS